MVLHIQNLHVDDHSQVTSLEHICAFVIMTDIAAWYRNGTFSDSLLLNLLHAVVHQNLTLLTFKMQCETSLLGQTFA